MIYYIILLTGLILLALNNLKWLKIKKSVSTKRKEKLKNGYFLILFFKKTLNEWLSYLTDILREKNTLHILMPIVYSVSIYSVNYFLFHFN
ncbi:tight adherance operon protein, partial [Yersinia enterocolitica]